MDGLEPALRGRRIEDPTVDESEGGSELGEGVVDEDDANKPGDEQDEDADADAEDEDHGEDADADEPSDEKADGDDEDQSGDADPESNVQDIDEDEGEDNDQQDDADGDEDHDENADQEPNVQDEGGADADDEPADGAADGDKNKDDPAVGIDPSQANQTGTNGTNILGDDPETYGPPDDYEANAIDYSKPSAASNATDQVENKNEPIDIPADDADDNATVADESVAHTEIPQENVCSTALSCVQCLAELPYSMQECVWNADQTCTANCTMENPAACFTLQKLQSISQDDGVVDRVCMVADDFYQQPDPEANTTESAKDPYSMVSPTVPGQLERGNPFVCGAEIRQNDCVQCIQTGCVWKKTDVAIDGVIKNCGTECQETDTACFAFDYYLLEKHNETPVIDEICEEAASYVQLPTLEEASNVTNTTFTDTTNSTDNPVDAATATMCPDHQTCDECLESGCTWSLEDDNCNWQCPADESNSTTCLDSLVDSVDECPSGSSVDSKGSDSINIDSDKKADVANEQDQLCQSNKNCTKCIETVLDLSVDDTNQTEASDNMQKCVWLPDGTCRSPQYCPTPLSDDGTCLDAVSECADDFVPTNLTNSTENITDMNQEPGMNDEDDDAGGDTEDEADNEGEDEDTDSGEGTDETTDEDVVSGEDESVDTLAPTLSPSVKANDPSSLQPISLCVENEDCFSCLESSGCLWSTQLQACVKTCPLGSTCTEDIGSESIEDLCTASARTIENTLASTSTPFQALTTAPTPVRPDTSSSGGETNKLLPSAGGSVGCPENSNIVTCAFAQHPLGFMGVAAIFPVFCILYCIRRKMRAQRDDPRGQYRAVAARYGGQGFDNTFSDDFSADGSMEFGGSNSDVEESWAKSGKRVLELSDMGRNSSDDLSIDEMNG